MATRRFMTVADLLAAAPSLRGGHGASFAETLIAHQTRQLNDQDFNEAGPINLAATANIQQEVIRWPQTGKVSQAECAWVDGVAMGVANLGDFDKVKWQILVDGMPWPGFDSIIGPFGVFVYPKPVAIPLVPSQLVQIVAINISAPLVVIPQVTAYLMGRRFPTLPDSAGASGG